MPVTPRSSYRLPDRTRAIIRAIAEARGGLTDTQVIVNAVELHGRQVLGRRLNDLVPVARRDAEPPRGGMTRRA